MGPEGDMLLRRRTLAGHCHIHLTALVREPDNVQVSQANVAIGL